MESHGASSKLSILLFIISMALSASPSSCHQLKAIAVLDHGEGITKGVKGTLYFEQQGDSTKVSGEITGLSHGLHGFHIHAKGDFSNGCESTGIHFNPFNKPHGGREDVERHAGDLGNIMAGDNGIATFNIVDNQIPLSGANSIIGMAVVVHEKEDDLGRGGTKLSRINGNAGKRIACGLIKLQQ